MSKLECDIVKDLLPLYIEDLTSPVTATAVESHLKECSDCQTLYEQLKEPETTKETEKEIDYLKKVRTHSRKKLVTAIVGLCLLILAGLSAKRLLIGSLNESCDLTVQTNDTYYVITGTIADDSVSYFRDHLKTNGSGMELALYTGQYSLLHSSKEIGIAVKKSDVGEYLIVNGNKYYPDGRCITSLAQTLYTKKNPYIGNHIANGSIAIELRIGETIGAFTNSLQTKTEPYGWHFELTEPISSVKESFLNEKMASYSYALLALVDNAGYISWSYTLEDSNQTIEKKISVKDADAALHSSIKKYADSPESIQELLTLVNLS